ncbi:LPS-assembly protein LptD [bacterium]|nr:LPS-assembly protein LptD [bacterium]
MKRKEYIAIFLMAIFIFIAVINGYSEENEAIHFRADYVEYDEDSKDIYAKGNITINYGDVQLNCNEAAFNTEEKKIQAKGKVILKDIQGTFFGETMEYNLETKEGKIDNAKFSTHPWYCGGPKIEKKGPEKIIIYGGFFTTCDLDSPHYSLHSKKIVIYPERKIVAYNVLFYVGKVPILYLPFYIQSLKKRKYKLDMRVGSNTEQGTFVKTKFGYPLSLYTYGKVYLDWMSEKGVGVGLEFDYDVPEVTKGSFYVYHIKEKDIETERWNSRFSHWHRINQSLTGTADLNFMSDRLFNDEYKFIDSPSEITPDEGDLFNYGYNEARVNEELKSHVSLTLNRDVYQATIAMKRKDHWEDDSFEKEYVYSPEFSLSGFPRKLISIKNIPLYWRGSLNAQNYYTSEIGHYLFSADAKLGLTSGFPLNRYMRLTPEVDFHQFLEDECHHNQYDTRTNLRIHPVWWLDMDVIYDLEDTLYKKDGCAQNIEPLDKLSNRNLFRFNSYTNFIISTGYNFRGILEGKMDNLIAELQFISPQKESYLKKVYFKDIYDINEGENHSLQGEFLWEKNERWYVKERFNYLSYNLNMIDVNTGIGFWLIPKKLKLEGNLRYDFCFSEINTSKPTEKEIIIWKDLHCWEAWVSWKKRAYDEEIWLMLNLKVFPNRKLGVHHNVEQNEWDFRTKSY